MGKTAPLKILSLDIGTTCGWAFSKGQKIIAWGVHDFKVRRRDTNAPGHRLIEFYNWLADFGGVDEVYYESVAGFQSSQGADKVYYGMLGVIEMFCAGYDIPLIGMHTTTLKHQFTGNGRAKKDEMCALAHRLGWTGGRVGTDQDHDACDACALIICIQKRYGVEITF